MSDRWPALMNRETAAAYCDMTPSQFDRQCFVAPVDQGWRGLRWKKAKLDAWIEGLPEKPRAKKAALAQIGIDSPPKGPADDERVRDTPGGLSAEARKQASLSRF